MSKKTLFWLTKAVMIYFWLWVTVMIFVYDEHLPLEKLLLIYTFPIFVTAVLFPLYQWYFKRKMKKRNVDFDTLLNLPKKEQRKMVRDILSHNSKFNFFKKK